MDFFAGSGTTGLAAARNNRKYILIDENPEAIALMQLRLKSVTHD
jgi:site-specific DNA-methyltransferase (adenine-specific)